METLRYNRSIEHLIETGRLEPMIKADELLLKLNSLPLTHLDERLAVIRELFGSVGINPTVSRGFQCDFGCNIHVGDNFYAGYNCVMLDYAEIKIGDNCLIGPNVGIYTAGHDLAPINRYKTGMAKSITIDDNVWIGANSCILPGVNIGKGAVIAAGSVVTDNVKPNTVAGEVPAKYIKDVE